MDKQLIPLISQAEIAATVERLAWEVDRDYHDRRPILVGVLKGSFIFMADLVRAMQTPIANIELIRLASYGSSTTSSGQADLRQGLLNPEIITDQDVLLVEDIVDTGVSTTTALAYLQTHQPASLKLCSFLDKPSRRKQPVAIDYLGLTVPDRFIVGYGLDCAEYYRQLPAIYALEG